MDDRFALLEPGQHAFEIHSAHTEVSATGHPIARLVAEVLSGPDAGRTVTMVLIRSEENENAVTSRLAAVGLSPDWIRATGATWDEIVAELPGRCFLSEVRYREWPPGTRRFRNHFGQWEAIDQADVAHG